MPGKESQQSSLEKGIELPSADKLASELTLRESVLANILAGKKKKDASENEGASVAATSDSISLLRGVDLTIRANEIGLDEEEWRAELAGLVEKLEILKE